MSTKTVEYDGETYTISATPLDDVEALEAFEDRNFAILARTILGADQWRTYKGKKRPVSDLFELINALLASEAEEDTAPAE